MKKLRRVFSLSFIAVFLLLLTSCGSDQGVGSEETTEDGTYQWILVHEEYPGEPMDLFVNRFAEVLNEKSDGKISLQIFSMGQLGDGADLFELVQTGTVDFGLNSPGVVSTIIPETNIFNFHYLLPADSAKLDEFMRSDSAALAAINEKYDQQGVHVIEWVAEPANVWTANKPLLTPEDFQGVKFRTMVSPVISKSYSFYGANAVAIAYSELYTSLQLGMADGQVNPIAATLSNSFYEVQDYMTLSYPDYFVFSVNANDSFWASLPPEIQTLVEESAREAVDRYIVDRDNDRDAALEELRGMINVVEMSEEQRDVFRQIAEDHGEQLIPYLGDDGEKLLETITAELEEFR